MYIKYLHIVQILYVENGEPNLNKVLKEFEFETKEEAEDAVEVWNEIMTETAAVYTGCVKQIG